MWKINNESPFAVKGTVTQHYRTNRQIWVVGVKATFDILNDGSVKIAEEQKDLLDEPEYYGEELESSLKYETDLGQPKEKIDVILYGPGYQPGGKANNELDVGFAIGGWSKMLRVKGNRLWDRFLGIPLKLNPQPFELMSLRYENAFGGKDDKAKTGHEYYQTNMVGKGYAYSRFNLCGKSLPNIEYPDFTTKANHKKNKAAGFGAISNHWYPRVNHAGTYDENWQNTKAPLYPVDFSPYYFQYAPEDQQIDYLGGDEQVTLYNLMPDTPVFSFNLPDLSFSFYSNIDSSVFNHNGRLSAVIIEPDIPRLMMVWQTHTDCQDVDHLVESTLVNYKMINQ